MSMLPPLGGGGRSLTGLASNVTSEIVMSSEMLMSVEITGIAGRWICSGGGGISNSVRISTCVISSDTIDTSAAVISGQNASSAKWIAVAASTAPQNHV